MMNNTVTREVLESLGGLKDTIRPIANSLTSHELRPYELQIDYKQTIQDLRKEDQESMKQSMSCLKGQLDGPKPLYRRDSNDFNQMAASGGLDMIGKARLVSASPFRASVKLDNQDKLLNENSDDDDDEFDREELPELAKSRESPIKDDSELLRHQKTDFLANLSAKQSGRNESASALEAITNRSEKTPNLAAVGDLKGIMIRDSTRTSFDKGRNSGSGIAQIHQQ